MFNCYYNGPALSVYKNKELMSLLKETCPGYIKGKEGVDTKVCCDVAQLKTLKVQTGQARSLFSRCPACIDNFMKHFCFTTCDPDMSLYIEPRLQPKVDNKISVHQCTLKNGSNVTYLQSVNVTVDTDYASKLYNSCSNVQYPEESNKVISLMCGDTDKCSYSKWLSFLGDPAQDYNQAPFLMQYQYSEEHDPKMTPFTTNLTKCSDKGPLQCSCSDCPTPELCPPLPKASPGETKLQKYLVMILPGFVCLSITIVLFVTSLVWAIVTSCNDQNDYVHVQNEADDEVDSSTSSNVSINNDPVQDGNAEVVLNPFKYLALVGSYMEFVIKLIAYRWGVIASRCWFLVIPAMFLLFGCLCGGIYFFKLTTDPVKLWSSPTSRARLEKNYFDQNFGPFYRTEQVIIRPKHMFGSYSMTIKGIYSPVSFGPVFTSGVLTEVFYLQNNLSSITVNGSNGSVVTLNDICFKPLSPDNNNCTIESVINYFQNNLTRLQYFEADDFGFQNINASSHIHYCTR